jgi:hypothetical protein
MKRTLYILAILALLAGCSDPGLEGPATTTPPAESAQQPTASAKPTEVKKAEIAKKYGIENPEDPTDNVSMTVVVGFAQSQPEPASTPEAVPEPETPPEQDVLFNMMDITNQSETAVKALLGTPIKTETGEWTLHRPEEKTTFTRHVYAAEIGEVKVIFIKGKAVRIEVKPKEAFTFPDDAIKAMRAAGLTVRDGLEPESGGTHFLDFAGIDGVYAVRVLEDLEGSPGNIGYIMIVTADRYT